MYNVSSSSLLITSLNGVRAGTLVGICTSPYLGLQRNSCSHEHDTGTVPNMGGKTSVPDYYLK